MSLHRSSVRDHRGGPATLAVLAVLAALLSLVTVERAGAAQPVPGHGDRLVPETPTAGMPRISGGEIWDLEVVPRLNRVFIAGSFGSLANTVPPTTTVNQPFLASYNYETGLIDTSFRPSFSGGGVTAVEASPDGTKLFVGGSFNAVNGVTRQKVASLDLTTGAPLAGFAFNRTTNNQVTAIEATDDTVYIGGRFSRVNGVLLSALAAADAVTGAIDTGFDNQITGGIGVNGALGVPQLKLTHDESKLLVVHTGRQVDGQGRLGMALVDTVTKQLLPWRSRLWDDNLARVGGVTRIYAADIAPDDSYFVVTSGSGGDAPPISDTAVAYPLEGGDHTEPLWVSRAFDSIYSVAISESAVYIGGHFQFLESPSANVPWPGLDNVGYGTGQGLSGYGLGDQVVRRDHIGALDPATGTAVEWNPGSNSFEGNKAMVAFDRGLFIGGDGMWQGGRNTGRVAFYDLEELPPAGLPDTTIVAPIEGRVVAANQQFVLTGQATVSGAQGAVQRVNLLVRDRGTGRFLQDDLTTWGTTQNTINPTLGAGTSSREWALPLTVSGNRQLQVTARTRSTSGATDTTPAVKKFESFQLDDQTPTTRISGPGGFGSILTDTTFTMTGTASDDHGVVSLSYWFRDEQGRYLQNDGTVGDVFNTFRGTPDVIGAPEATWSHEVTLPHEGVWRGSATATDTGGQADLRSATRDWTINSSAAAPTVTLEQPVQVTPPFSVPTLVVEPGSPMTFSGTATDEAGLKNVEITLRSSTTGEALGADGTWGAGIPSRPHRISPADISGATYDWSWTTPFDLSPGAYSFSVRATDDEDLTTSRSNQVNLSIQAQVPGDAPPDGLLTGSSSTAVPITDPRLELSGTASDDVGVDRVELTVLDSDTGRYLQPDGSMESTVSRLPATLDSPGATSTGWSLVVDLPTAGDWRVTARATDTSGQQDTSTSGATARYSYYPGDAPPGFEPNLGQPVDGTVFDEGKIVVTGRAIDDLSIARVDVAVMNQAGAYMSSSGAFTSTTPSWRAAFLNSPGSPGSNFSYTTPVIPAGTYQVQVRATDHHDQVGELRIADGVVVNTPANEPPVAGATVECEENVCAFDARSSTDENPTSLTYSWSYGTSASGVGQGSGTGPVPVKSFTAPGPFTVTLTVRDQWGATATTTVPVEITAPSGNRPPVPVLASQCAAATCSTSSNGTTDPDTGDVVTHTWEWGDGTTTTGSSGSHTYAAGGTYTIRLTSTDGWGAAATTTRNVVVEGPAGDQPPAAAFAIDCDDLSCSVDGTASSDQEGPIAQHVWSWGDGTADARGATASHDYAEPGTYTVRLTVTDGGGLAGTTTRTVEVTAPAEGPEVAFRSANSSTGNVANPGVRIPSGVQVGDTLVLFLTINRETTIGNPVGWDVLGSRTGPRGELQTRVWTRTVAAGDAGTTVRAPLGVRSKYDLTVAAYSGVSTDDPVAAWAAAPETRYGTSHTTPTVPVTGDGDWLVSYWTEKTNTGSDWVAPAGQRVRAEVIGSGSGRVNSLLTDSASGSGGLTATSDTASSKAVMWSVVLNRP